MESTVTFNEAVLPGPNPMSSLMHHKFNAILDDAGNVTDVSSSTNMPRRCDAADPAGRHPINIGRHGCRRGNDHGSAVLQLSNSTEWPGSKSDGETRMTLMNVTREAAGRIAHFAFTSSGRFTIEGSPFGSAQPGMTMEMDMDDKGTMDTNLDRGLVQAAGHRADVIMSFHRTSAAGAFQMQMKGPMTITQRIE